MTASAVITVTGNVTGLLSGTKTLLASIASALANGVTQQVVLQAGANTITLPTGVAPTGCLVILPATNTSVTTLKGLTADTGIAIGKVGFLLLTWDSTAPPTSFVLTSVSTQTGLVTEIVFF